jgi:hypothetical protein
MKRREFITSIEKFVAHPGKSADSVWKDGHSIAAADCDMDAVRQIGRKLGPKHIAERKRSR